MKNLIKLFLLLLIPVIGVFLLSYPMVWKFRIENILNKKVFKESGWELNIGELSGHLLREIESKDVEIIHENGTSIHIPKLITQIDLLNSLTGRIHLVKLGLNDIYYNQTTKSSNSIFVLPDLKYDKFPLEIDLLTFDGTLQADLPDDSHSIDLNVKSAINTNDLGLNIFIDSLYIKHEDYDYSIKLNGTETHISNREVSLNHFNGTLGEVIFYGNLRFVQDDNQSLGGELNVDNIIIPEKLFDRVPVDIEFSTINSSLKFNTDFNQYRGDVILENDLGLRMTGDFNIKNDNNNWLINKISLKSKDATLIMIGKIYDQYADATFDLNQFDISQWLPDQPKTNISGFAELASNTTDGVIDSLSMNLKLQETDLFQNDTIDVHGSFNYENSNLSFSEPFRMTLGESSIYAEGQLDFSDKKLDLVLELADVDAFIINNFWKDSLESGQLSGNLNITGEFDRIDAEGQLFGQNIQYNKLYLDEIDIQGERKYSNNYLGTILVRINTGHYDSIKFTSADIEAELYKNNTRFKKFSLYNEDDYLLGVAKYDNKNTIFVEELDVLYNNHKLKSSTPFDVKIDSNYFSISQFAAQLDSGNIEGNLIRGDHLEGNLIFSNISSEYLYPIIKNERQRFTGMMFGEIQFIDNKEYQDFIVDMVVNDGGFSKRPFAKMIAKLDYIEKILHIKKIDIVEGENSIVNIKGYLPYGDKKTTEKIRLNFDLKNTDYNTIAQFLPDWFDINGVVNGQMSINGYGHDMKTNIIGTIKEGKFERVKIGNGSFRSEYDGNNLILKSFSSDLTDNHLTGYGFLPIDLNLYSDNFGKFRDSDSLYLFIEGKTNNLNFITNYFDEVDSAPGDYTLALELSGLWKSITRNGRLSINNAMVNTPLLDDPIRQLNGFVQIIDNKLIFEDLRGKMYKNTRRLNRLKENISISGNMDMSEFFDPIMNIHAEGSDAYFRSLIYEMEGTTDFDIAVTGRDTILIAGEVAPINVEMFQPLTTNDLGVLPSEEGSTIIHYKMDFPIKGEFKLINDQLDITMVGDVSINQFGDKESDFAGELTIIEGKFYYYGDAFTIKEGDLIFDGRGFNPYLNISAYTEIDNEHIDMTIFGYINNPTLTFTSESGFSQSDILELLTWRKRFEEQELSSTQLGYQASDLVIAWFGSQLDKNILQFSGLDRLGILENVDVRGTSGLITAEEDFSISAPLTDNMAINYAYRRSFGLNESYHSLGLEVQLNRNLSLIGNIDRSGYMHVKYRLRYSY